MGHMTGKTVLITGGARGMGAITARELAAMGAERIFLVDWEGEEGTVLEAPPASFFMRAESWFFGLLPIESQM